MHKDLSTDPSTDPISYNCAYTNSHCSSYIFSLPISYLLPDSISHTSAVFCPYGISYACSLTDTNHSAYTRTHCNPNTHTHQSSYSVTLSCPQCSPDFISNSQSHHHSNTSSNPLPHISSYTPHGTYGVRSYPLQISSTLRA